MGTPACLLWVASFDDTSLCLPAVICSCGEADFCFCRNAVAVGLEWWTGAAVLQLLAWSRGAPGTGRGGGVPHLGRSPVRDLGLAPAVPGEGTVSHLNGESWGPQSVTRGSPWPCQGEGTVPTPAVSSPPAPSGPILE